MARIVFYEKPGCANNARQKRLLEAAGHEVLARNLLTEPWTADRLRTFFTDLPVAEWFNRAAPRVKSEEVAPEKLDEATALALMLADPLLIRRPLLQVGSRREAGFDWALLEAWLGFKPRAEISADPAEVLETCPGATRTPRANHDKASPVPTHSIAPDRRRWESSFSFSLAGRPVAHEFVQCRSRQRTAEEVALHRVAAVDAQEFELFLRLHTLGDDVEPQGARQDDDRLDDGGVVLVGGDVAHERAI